MRVVKLAMIVATWTLAAPAAEAQDVPIAAFTGVWGGSAIANNADSLYFGVTVRDMDIEIRETEDGFTITWTTVIRGGGTPEQPDERRRTTTMDYVEAGAPDRYRAASSGDPLDGEVLSWARITGPTLIIYLMAINEDGAYELSRYQRTLIGGGMELTFTRLRDGEPVREVSGRLVKHGE